MTHKEFYNELKTAASSSEYMTRMNFDEIFSIPLGMFEYDGIPEELYEYWECFESWLCGTGCVAIGYLDGKLIFAKGGLGGGRINDYGFMTEFIGATMNGKAIRWEIGKDCVVFWNNKLHRPDADIWRTVDLLDDIDISITDNVLYSRFYPVPMAKDSKIFEQIKTIFENLKKGGKKTTVINRNADVSDIIAGGGDPVPVLNLTDVKNADKIQYLIRARDDVKRWFCTRYGQAVQGTGKMAQQTEDEIDGYTSVSFIYPLEKYEMRKKAVEQVNELFGLNLEIHFSPAWMVEFKKFVMEAPEPDGLEEKEGQDVQTEIMEDIIQGAKEEAAEMDDINNEEKEGQDDETGEDKRDME